MTDTRPWRKIVRREQNTEERASLTTRSFSWSATTVWKLTLECGHVQNRRGLSCPKHKVICKSCEKGLAPDVDPATVEPGDIDKTPRRPRNGFANALVDSWAEDAKARSES